MVTLICTCMHKQQRKHRKCWFASFTTGKAIYYRAFLSLPKPNPNPIGYTILYYWYKTQYVGIWAAHRVNTEHMHTTQVRWAVFGMDIYLLDMWHSVLQPAGLKLSWKVFWKSEESSKYKNQTKANPKPYAQSWTSWVQLLWTRSTVQDPGLSWS